MHWQSPSCTVTVMVAGYFFPILKSLYYEWRYSSLKSPWKCSKRYAVRCYFLQDSLFPLMTVCQNNCAITPCKTGEYYTAMNQSDCSCTSSHVIILYLLPSCFAHSFARISQAEWTDEGKTLLFRSENPGAAWTHPSSSSEGLHLLWPTLGTDSTASPVHTGLI